MTSFVDDFQALDLPWIPYLAGGGSILAVGDGDYLVTTAAGNYLVYGTASLGPISAVSDAATAVITCAAPHGWTIGQQFGVQLEGFDLTGVYSGLDGYLTATATSTTEFAVAVDTSTGGGYTPTGNEVVTVAGGLTGSDQELEISFSQAAEGSGPLLFGRFDATGSLTTYTQGYGCALIYDVGGGRTLWLYKVNALTGDLEALASVDVAEHLELVGDSDLGVRQTLRFVIVNETDSGRRLPEMKAVLLRAYVNEDEDDRPALEIRDLGVTESGESPGFHRGPGTWAVSFASSNLRIHAFAGRDDYVLQDGEYKRGHRTLAELRAATQMLITRGTTAVFEPKVYNAAIEDALMELRDTLGRNAMFLQRMEEHTLTQDADSLVTLPRDIHTINDIYDGTSKYAVAWRFVAYDADGRMRIHMPEQPSGRSFLINYIAGWDTMNDDDDPCPVPRQWDELVRLSAAMRLVGDSGVDAAFEQRLRERYVLKLQSIRTHANRVRYNDMTRITTHPHRQGGSGLYRRSGGPVHLRGRW